MDLSCCPRFLSWGSGKVSNNPSSTGQPRLPQVIQWNLIVLLDTINYLSQSGLVYSMLRILYWAQGDDLVGPPQTSHDKKEKKWRQEKLSERQWARRRKWNEITFSVSLLLLLFVGVGFGCPNGLRNLTWQIKVGSF